MNTADIVSVSNAQEQREALMNALERIRHLKDSKLENQRAPAQLLVAIEATLAERANTQPQEPQQERQTEPAGPTQYLLALESLLSAENTSADVHASSVYLLSIVLPHVAPGVVRAKSHALLGAVAAPLADPHGGAAENMNARLRASLGVVESLLHIVPVRERNVLERERTWLAVWDLVLGLCIDARPKVRRRAHELVTHILSEPACSHAHPYADRTMMWAARLLHGVAAARGISHSKGGHPHLRAPTIEYDKNRGKAKHAMSAAAERQKQAVDGAASTGIWICALLQTIVPAVPVASTTPLVHELLALPALQNPFLTVAVYDVFSALFRTPRVERSLDMAVAPVERHTRDVSLLRHTLDELCKTTNVPAHTDVQTLPAYLGVLEACMVAYSAADLDSAWSLVPTLWHSSMTLALSAQSDASRASSDVRSAGRKFLQALAHYCVPDHAVADALKAHNADEVPLSRMISSLREALGKHALRYTHTRSDILHILASMLSRLRYPLDVGGPPPAEPLLMQAVVDVAALRAHRHFDARPDADVVLGSAISACGPRVFLSYLPLDLLDAKTGRPNTQGGVRGRAWLLPLLREHISNTELAHFVEELVPLSEALFEVRVQAEQPSDGSAPRPVEAKVMEALIEQIWVCFPGYCDLCRDVDTSLTPHVLELLINVLRTQTNLRPAVLKGLELLVQRNESLISSQVDAAQLQRQFGVDQAAGRRFLEHLRAMSGVLLAALFQLLTELPSQSRGFVMDCIATYLAILDSRSVAATFEKVAAMLKQSLATYVPSAPAPGMPEANSPRYVPPVPHTMLDLFIALVPYVKRENAAALFDACMQVLTVDDSGLQKKAYRALSRLLSTSEAPALRARKGSPAALVTQLLEQDVPLGAVRDRLALFRALVPYMPDADLGSLAALVPEAVLGTKEANQGAREEAYCLLVEIGHRMARGGRIDRSQAGTDMQDTVAASVPEYVMMVAAGLAGASPRMMGASITALARLLYEFHTSLPTEMLSELLATMLVYLESTNREIAKGALGFCKVAAVVLPAQHLEPSLPELVPALLHMRTVHKNHFKTQVRHLIERLLRRFGFDAIQAHVDIENQRLISNIRKRKERAKRRRSQTSSSNPEDEELDGNVAMASVGSLGAHGRPARGRGTDGMDAFEDALYGSDSDDDDDSGDDDSDYDEKDRRREPQAQGRGNNKKKQPTAETASRRTRHREDDAFLLEDDDAPMDLLDEAAVGAIRTNVRQKTRRQPGQEARTFETDDAGRLRITDEDDARMDDDATAAAASAEDEASRRYEGTAFMEKSMGVDGFTHRGRGGAVKFNKNNKRTRANERMDDELDDVDANNEANHGRASVPSARRGKKRGKEAIGSEFRAKRAQGDVQKGGMSPYAYVPLSSVSGKKAKDASKLAITGKRRKT